jgi:hypothetical protein
MSGRWRWHTLGTSHYCGRDVFSPFYVSITLCWVNCKGKLRGKFLTNRQCAGTNLLSFPCDAPIRYIQQSSEKCYRHQQFLLPSGLSCYRPPKYQHWYRRTYLILKSKSTFNVTDYFCEHVGKWKYTVGPVQSEETILYLQVKLIIVIHIKMCCRTCLTSWKTQSWRKRQEATFCLKNKKIHQNNVIPLIIYNFMRLYPNVPRTWPCNLRSLNYFPSAKICLILIHLYIDIKKHHNFELKRNAGFGVLTTIGSLYVAERSVWDFWYLGQFVP